MRIKGLIFTILAMLFMIDAYCLYTMVCKEPPLPMEITPVEIIETQPQQQTTTEITTIQETQPQKPRQPPNIEIPLDEDLKSYIYDLCDHDDDLYCLIMAVIEEESQFDEDAVSADGHDHGLMQLRDTYHDDWIEKYSVSDPTEPYDNVTVGINLIKGYLNEWEYKNLALMCYNNGESGARNLWKSGTYSTEYTVKVLNSYEEYAEVITP